MLEFPLGFNMPRRKGPQGIAAIGEVFKQQYPDVARVLMEKAVNGDLDAIELMLKYGLKTEQHARSARQLGATMPTGSVQIAIGLLNPSAVAVQPQPQLAPGRHGRKYVKLPVEERLRRLRESARKAREAKLDGKRTIEAIGPNYRNKLQIQTKTGFTPLLRPGSGPSKITLEAAPDAATPIQAGKDPGVIDMDTSPPTKIPQTYEGIADCGENEISHHPDNIKGDASGEAEK